MSRVLISADSHITEPNELYVQHAPERFRDRVPQWINTENSVTCMCEGKPVYKSTFTDAESWEQFKKTGADPDERIRDMKVDGVSGELILGAVAQWTYLSDDPELQRVSMGIYNDWLGERFLPYKTIFAPAALLPTRRVEDTVAEFERCLKKGFNAVLLPMCAPEERPWADAAWEPVWKLAAQAKIPLAFHVGMGMRNVGYRGPGAAIINFMRVCIPGLDTLGQIVACGALARYPDLHVVMIETNVAFIGWLQDVLDTAWSEHAQWLNPKLELAPSAYIARQAHATFSKDRAAIPQVRSGIIPPQCMMWGSDYPHLEGSFPHSRQVVDENFNDSGLTEAQIDQMVGGTARKLWGIGAEAAAQ
ncbi:MAG: amidohydrolase family protein [Gammaproteobacteria bacterium]